MHVLKHKNSIEIALRNIGYQEGYDMWFIIKSKTNLFAAQIKMNFAFFKWRDNPKGSLTTRKLYGAEYHLVIITSI